jgi:ankyrin repeat protein
LCSEEQVKLDQNFLQAVEDGNADEVANLLDAGADINACKSGSSLGDQKFALSLCIEKIETSSSPQDSNFQIANLLLLYHETLLEKFANSSCTLLHACMKHRIAVIVERIPANAQILGVQDSFGNSPLHQAVLAGDRGLSCIEALCKKSMIKGFKLGEISDSEGRSPLQLALEKGLDRQALLLGRLGGAGKVNRDAIASSELLHTICDAFKEPYCQSDKRVSLEDLLQLAILNSRPRAVEELLARGAVWDVETLNTDDIVENVRSAAILLQLLQRRSVPNTRSIDITHLIYDKIWHFDRTVIEAALRGDRQNLFHECHRSPQPAHHAYFVLSRRKYGPSLRKSCIHTVLNAVLSLLDEYPLSVYPSFMLDGKLESLLEPWGDVLRAICWGLHVAGHREASLVSVSLIEPSAIGSLEVSLRDFLPALSALLRDLFENGENEAGVLLCILFFLHIVIPCPLF